MSCDGGEDDVNRLVAVLVPGWRLSRMFGVGTGPAGEEDGVGGLLHFVEPPIAFRQGGDYLGKDKLEFEVEQGHGDQCKERPNTRWLVTVV